MNNFGYTKHAPEVNMAANIPGVVMDRGILPMTVDALHKEIVQLSEEIGFLGERLSPLCSEKPVASSPVNRDEEKQGPASRHTEALRELQSMVKTCRTRINVIMGQLDI